MKDYLLESYEREYSMAEQCAIEKRMKEEEKRQEKLEMLRDTYMGKHNISDFLDQCRYDNIPDIDNTMDVCQEGIEDGLYYDAFDEFFIDYEIKGEYIIVRGIF